MPQTLTVAFCLCDGVTLSDFIPPSELIAGLNAPDHPDTKDLVGDVPYRVKFDFLAPTLKPVAGFNPGTVAVNPTKTYDGAIDEGIQYDILWVPAGPIPDPKGEKIEVVPPSEIAFIKAQAPKAKYVMSVCAGSGILAQAGVLSGKKATTNKALFKLIEAVSPKDITWVAKARWVVDGNIWTSSGVSAGSDMALAFIAHIAGDDIAKFIRGINEVTEHGEGDDPFAAIHGLA